MFWGFAVILKKPNFKEVQISSIPRCLAIPCLLPVCFGESLVPHSQHFCPKELYPQLLPKQEQGEPGKVEQLPLLSLCLLWFCLLGIQRMPKSVKKKEPNRSLVFVRDLRRAKEASQKQVVAFSPEKTALLTALLHRRQEPRIPHVPTVQPGNSTWEAPDRLQKGFDGLKALK